MYTSIEKGKLTGERTRKKSRAGMQIYLKNVKRTSELSSPCLRADHYSTLYIVSYIRVQKIGKQIHLNRIALRVIITLSLLKHVYA